MAHLKSILLLCNCKINPLNSSDLFLNLYWALHEQIVFSFLGVKIFVILSNKDFLLLKLISLEN